MMVRVLDFGKFRNPSFPEPSNGQLSLAGTETPALTLAPRPTTFLDSGFCPASRGISSAGRALAWHARGHRFKSVILHFCCIQKPSAEMPEVFYLVSARLTERESDRRISKLVQGTRGFNGRQSLNCSNRVRTGASPRCGRRSCGGMRDCQSSPPQFVAFRSAKRTCLNSAAATFAKTPSGSEWKMPRILLSAAFCHPSHACPSCRQSRMWRLPAPGPHPDRCKSESSSRALQSPVFGSDLGMVQRLVWRI